MSLNFRRCLSVLCTIAIGLLHVVALAQASEGEEVYRCRVLGDSRACSLVAPEAREDSVKVVPGSRARYLIHLGWSVDRAIAEARLGGEEVSFRITGTKVGRPASGAEAHDRYVGRLQSSGAGHEPGMVDKGLLVAR